MKIISRIIIVYSDGSHDESPFYPGNFGGGGTVYGGGGYGGGGTPDGIFKSCPKCSIDLSKVMSYNCNSPDCPCGLGTIVH